MHWLYGVIIVFSLLTVYLVYVEYKKNAHLKAVFTIISIIESLVVALIIVLFFL